MSRAEHPPDEQGGLQATVDAIYDKVKAGIELRDVTAGNIMTLLTLTMVAVEQSVSGPGKKAVAVAVVRRLAGEIPGDAGDRLAVQGAVDLLLPALIDTVVDATRGELALNGARPRAARPSWAACCPCLPSAPAE